MKWLQHLETYKKKKQCGYCLGMILKLKKLPYYYTCTLHTLQNVNWKYLDSQLLNNFPRANKSSNHRIKTIQDLYVTIRITCQDFLPANWV